METAIRDWCKWFKNQDNRQLFNLNILRENQEEILNNVQGDEDKSSLVNAKRLEAIYKICINRKDNKISQNIKELFKGCDKNYHNIFVHNINNVLHGNCIDIDEKSLKKYDEYVLSYLKMISLSKRSKEK